MLVSEGDLTGRRVLEVGSGTGRFLAALGGRARAWGVDPAPEMLEVARGRAHAAGLKLGTAEELPFKDGWFERAVMWLVVHLLDRPRAFAELHRVLAPDGRLAIATFDPSYFGAFWLNDYFPSMEEADRARFPLLHVATVFMTALLVGTFGVFGLHTLLWLPRSMIDLLRRHRGGDGGGEAP